MESLLSPPNGFEDPPLLCEQPVAIKMYLLQRSISGTEMVWRLVDSGQHRRQTEAFPANAHAEIRHDQRRNDVSAGSGGIGKD